MLIRKLTLEIELEFGLKAMQNNRLIRLIEEAEAQDALLSTNDLVSLCNITPTSIRGRLKKLREKGLGLRLRGLGSKDRRSNGLSRECYLLTQLIKGRAADEVRKECFMSRNSFQKIIKKCIPIMNSWAKGEHKIDSNIDNKAKFYLEKYIRVFEHSSIKSIQRLISKYPWERKFSSESCLDPYEWLSKELQDDFNYSPVKIRSLFNYLEAYRTLLEGSREKDEIIYWAVSSDAPVGRPIKNCSLIPVRFSYFDKDIDISSSNLKKDFNEVSSIKYSKMKRYTTETKYQGGHLNQADLGFLLGINVNAVRTLLEKHPSIILPLRGVERDMGRGITHRKKIIELYFQFYTETDIATRTGHSYDSIEAYLMEFSTVLVLKDRGLYPSMIRKVMGKSMKLIWTCLDLVKEYETDEYKLRFAQIKQIFLKLEARGESKKK